MTEKKYNIKLFGWLEFIIFSIIMFYIHGNKTMTTITIAEVFTTVWMSILIGMICSLIVIVIIIVIAKLLN